jgi:hypothetical protein
LDTSKLATPLAKGGRSFPMLAAMLGLAINAIAILHVPRTAPLALRSALALRASPRTSAAVMMSDFTDAEREALRLPSSDSDTTSLEQRPDDRMDPLGGGDADEIRLNQALFRVRRKAAAGAYNGTASRSLPLIALVAQVGVGAPLCAGLLYCYSLNQQADAGVAWAVEALGASDAWFGGAFSLLWGKPPGGPLCLLYALANGLNALRVAPQLFDRLLIARLPGASDVLYAEREDAGAQESSEGE